MSPLKYLALAALIGASSVTQAAQSQSSLPRPPQYVLLAFDGSLNLDFWQESYDFAAHNDVKFTYFISGVYFLMNQKKAAYNEPTHGPGHSSIGWGGNDPQKISERVEWVNRAYDDGHEIGSHANGHYDGTKWTLAQWRDEFRQFYRLIFSVLNINGLSTSNENPFHFSSSEIKGFRAPLLGRNESMYDVLRENHFSYDTSKTAPTNYWPEKQNGIWNFPLAEVRIAGTGKRTLSMDYNFYYSQSSGQPQPQRYAEFKKEMLETYLQYFASNYRGNRAPVNIGHHFSKWNGGAYWDAMKDFASIVCRLPEVKCVTYREYTQFMEGLPASTVAAYRRGQFDRSSMPSEPAVLAAVHGRTVKADVAMRPTKNVLSASLTGQQANALAHATDTRFEWTVDGKFLATTSRPSIDMAPVAQYVKAGSRIKVAVRYRGHELLTSTHEVQKPDRAGLNLERQLSPTAKEDYAMVSDPVEAHASDEESDAHSSDAL